MDARRTFRASLSLGAKLLPLMLAANLALVFLALFAPVGALVSAAVITAANFALLLFAQWRLIRRIDAEADALRQGVERIAEGAPASLPESGEFAGLCAALNRAGYRSEERERTRVEWVRGISHDIRTPLSLVLGYAGELEDDPGLPLDARSQAGIIRRQAGRLRRLVEDLNLITKLEAHMRPLKPELLLPEELARRAIVEFLEQEPGERWPVELCADGAGRFMRGDESLLTRMLGNLLQNAAAHNPGGCRIALTVAGGDGDCRFVVADDGVGATAGKLAELNAEDFPDSAARLSAAPGGSSAAHGLGLQLVCRIVQAHSGRIHFASASPHGFRVEVTLKEVTMD